MVASSPPICVAPRPSSASAPFTSRAFRFFVFVFCRGASSRAVERDAVAASADAIARGGLPPICDFNASQFDIVGDDGARRRVWCKKVHATTRLADADDDGGDDDGDVDDDDGDDGDARTSERARVRGAVRCGRAAARRRHRFS